MDMQFEEGEISDSNTSEEGDINPYTPLERPPIHFEPPAIRTVENDEDDLEEDDTSRKPKKSTQLLKSDSETDEEQTVTKRLKLSPTPAPKSKYTIWNKDPNGGLTDFFNQVGMDEYPPPETSRDVESYPLPFPNNSNKFNDLRLRKRKIPFRKKFSEGQKNALKKVRNLDSLEVTEENTIEEVAEDITNKLSEYNRNLILRIVIVLGKDKAIQLYEKTRVIEKLGGMLIANGSRKRTSGGVFISLVRTNKELSIDKIKAIFEDDDVKFQEKHKKFPKKKKKKKIQKNTRKIKNSNSSELSNPPPSPNVPGSPPRSPDVLTKLANLDQQKGMSEFQLAEDDDDVLSYEDIDYPELE